MARVISVRNVIAGLGLAFTAYLAARGLWWTDPVDRPVMIVAALVLYLATTWLCIFWQPARLRPRAVPESESALGTGPRPSPPLPVTAAALALACAALVPSAISFSVPPDVRTAAFATWYLGGIGALMTIVMVRRRPWVAWTGTLLLGVAAMLWMGVAAALQLGLVGSVVWVAVAQVMLGSIDRAARDTSRLAQLQRAASAWQASHVVRQRERRAQVQRALAVAGPVLTRTIAAGGALDDDDRLEARLAEGRLRDELRGPRLLDDEVRSELDRARRRGASVTVLDEGGLDGLADAQLDAIRARLAETLRSARSDRLYIRTSPHESVAVTVVGRSASGPGLSDEDAVDLWEEISHGGA
ncbi:hypothetical protein [Microbacterium hominis]|uniref:Uncharacterized protein n=1 Tax=Microbacterium hominis TaxID=162426 RepID=A0A7D4TP38_9MICO|nr:hypothetical protein [Microbacterium hominis]QKJ20042.1 hypothetical protein HQM25_12215 [Microbacterium hominis]